MSAIRNFFEQASALLPEVAKPVKKLSLRAKLMWTSIVVLLYLIMGDIPLYGIAPGAEDPFRYARIIFASRHGTLLELGIGPIVTAGLIMQLLRGADIIKFDFRKPEDRALFTSTTKLLTIIIAVIEAAAFIVSGYMQLVRYTFLTIALVFLQLMFATIILMLLDELIQKGWGLGSGISLFIAVGVAQEIFINLFSILPIKEGDQVYPFGFIPFLITKAMQQDFSSIFIRPYNYPSLLGFLATLLTILLIIYVEGIRIEIPISMAKYRGIRSMYPIRLLYVSNIPIILTFTFLTDVQIIARLIRSYVNDPIADVLVKVENQTIMGGLVYYILPPSSYLDAVADPLRAITSSVLVIVMAILFAVIWVEVAGLSSERIAEQLIDAGAQIPGFRRSAYSINILLSRYIPRVTIVSGAFVGAVASFSQIFGVFGGGMGILLMTDILMQYYQLLLREHLEELHPSIFKLLKVR